MANRALDAWHGLRRNPAASGFLGIALGTLLSQALTAGWVPLFAGVLVVAAVGLAAYEWKQAGRFRRELLKPILGIEVQGREYVVALSGGGTDGGNAQGPALMWSRTAGEWFRAEGFEGQADILKETIDPEIADYATPIANRKAQVERRVQAVVEKVLAEAKWLREKIEARIARR